MNHSTNEAGQPEQKLNNEQTAQDISVSPSIANAVLGAVPAHKFPYNWNLKDAVFTKDKGKVFSCFACLLAY